MGHRRQDGATSASAGRTSWGVLFLGVAIILASTAVALAIILSRNGGSSAAGNRPEAQKAAPAAGTASVEGADSPVEAGRYVQAGSFKNLADAETEQRRLAALDIETELLSSDLAQELYPGFQILAVGPIQGQSEEIATIRKLRHGGVPTAFTRELSPAASNVRYGEVAGGWSGTLEEISSAHPRLNRKLNLTASFDPSGREGQLEVADLSCRLTLSADGSSGTALGFDQYPSCLGSGTWRIRPSGGTLMVTLLPPESDLIFLGTLNAA